MAKSRRRSYRRSSSGSNALPMLLVLAGAGVAVYAFTQSQNKVPLLAAGSTYVPPNTSTIVNSFFRTISNLFGSSDLASTGTTGTSPWYDLESALGKYPISQNPNLWSSNPVTRQLEFRGAYDIDIALATA
jgi:hypothetical protein